MVMMYRTLMNNDDNNVVDDRDDNDVKGSNDNGSVDDLEAKNKDEDDYYDTDDNGDIHDVQNIHDKDLNDLKLMMMIMTLMMYRTQMTKTPMITDLRLTMRMMEPRWRISMTNLNWSRSKLLCRV